MSRRPTPRRKNVRHTQGPGRHGYCARDQRLPEYFVWGTMIQRCCNPRCREYRHYGKRGIRVCPRWLAADGFPNFLRDVGRQPYPRASLNRIDNDGHYEPGNVRWATQREQRRNTRSNRILAHGGRALPLVVWAEELGALPMTLSQRLRRGWSVEEALTRPVEPRRPYSEWRPRRG